MKRSLVRARTLPALLLVISALWAAGVEAQSASAAQTASAGSFPSAALPRATELAPAVRFECPAAGGHVGFLDAPWPGRSHWLPQRLLAHFEHAGR